MRPVREVAVRWALLAALAASSGGGDGSAVTGGGLTVRFDGLSLDQIRFTLARPDGSTLMAMRPEQATPGAWLASPQDVMVFLPDAMAGQTVAVQATGMAAGAPTPAAGTATATLALYQLVPA